MIAPDEVLAHRAWLRRSRPFPHVVARRVFKGDFHQAVSDQLATILHNGLSDRPAAGRFSRNIPGYDAYGIGLDHATPEPAALFLSAGWRDLLCGLFDITPTPYVFAGSHHHATGSKSGFIHNDFNPVWFLRARDDTIQVPRQDLCAYKTGAGPAPEHERVEVVRGAVVIYFLLNDGWRAGDGGETGLYARADSCLTRPDARCAPENNSLLAFECTPHSFHAFLTNRRLPRTSIIMWVHRPLEEAIARFGEEHLERWKK